MSKVICVSACIVFFSSALFSQSVGIGTTTPNSSAALEISSNNKGVLLSRVTSVQRKAIALPVAGLMVFDTDKNSLYIFDGQQWQPLAFVTQNNMPPTERMGDSVKVYDHLGFSVDIDGDHAVAGAPADTVEGAIFRGSAYVFERVNGNWIQAAQLIASDGLAHDQFGYAVAVSGDYIAVSARFDDSTTPTAATSHGSVYIYHKVGGVWVQEFKLRAADYASGDAFGTSISMDNDRLVVGAIGDNNGAITSCGSIYFYQRSGITWNQVNKFFRTGTATGEEFGASVSVNGDYAIAGAPFADPSAVTNAGSVAIYVFGGGTWNLQTTINNTVTNYWFGNSVDINDTYAVIGSPKASGTGTVRTYRRTGSAWSPLLPISLQTLPSAADFGLSVSMSGDYVLVGRSYDENNSTYLFKLAASGNSWDFVREISFSRPVISYPMLGDFFPGKDIVAIDGENCIIGHPFLGLNGFQSGALLFLNVGD